jgi:tetratricopeptide (TPR) repeat protein
MNPATLNQTFATATQLQNAGRLAEAEMVYRQILREIPDQSETLCALGVLTFQIGQRDAGVELVRRAIALQPDNADFYANLGGLLSATHQRDAAIDALKRAIELRPNFPEVLAPLAALLYRRQRRPEAIAVANAALAQQPINPQVYCVLGDCYFDENNLAQAAACYKKALAQQFNIRAPIHSAIAPAMARDIGPSLWPDYHGPPIDPGSSVAKALWIEEADCPAPAESSDLAFVKEAAARSDLPSSQEIFSTDGEMLPCWNGGQEPWMTAADCFPIYFAIFQALGKRRMLDIGAGDGFIAATFAKAITAPRFYLGIEADSAKPAPTLKMLRSFHTDFEFALIEGFSWGRAEQHALVGFVLANNFGLPGVQQAVARAMKAGMFERFVSVKMLGGLAVLQVAG